MCRQVSSWVGDHQRIPAVDCFALFSFFPPFCYRDSESLSTVSTSDCKRAVARPGESLRQRITQLRLFVRLSHRYLNQVVCGVSLLDTPSPEVRVLSQAWAWGILIGNM